MSQRHKPTPLIFTAMSLALLSVGAVVCLAVDVGSGAPSDGLTTRFVNAFFRNGFIYLVSLPPINNVQRFGSTGLIQEFRDVSNSANRLALVKANTSTALPTNGSVDVAQVLANMYSYYQTVGVNTAGYPTTDTAVCPPIKAGACQYQLFDKNYALFAFDTAGFNGQNFAVRDPFYTKWAASGGVSGLGPAVDIERNITIGGVSATVQSYANGAIYNNTSGTLSGRVITVVAPIYAAYLKAGGHDGYLGLPTSDDFVLAGGGHRQSFQGGNLDYTSGTDPVLRLPVDTVSILPFSTTTYQLQLGDTLSFHANLYTASGVSVTDRSVTWVTTNNRVIAIESAAGSPDAVARAVGAGTAIVSAVSEGKTSASVRISVTSPCCQIGEGAPTPVIQQAMQDAVTRNRLSISLPAKSQAERTGSGYTQELFSSGSPSVRYLIAKSDQSPSAYVVTGDVLIRYDQLGGPSGSLGYPSSDGVPGAHQLFQNASSLAATPVRLVAGAILAKWAALNFESGPAGSPTADAATVTASSGNRAQQQTFAGGQILAATTGQTAGSAQFVSGLILARYVALGGPAGSFGLPTDDEFGLDGRRRQDFEAGYIDFAPGDQAAVEHGVARRPSVSANPSGAVVAGSRLRIAVTGFADGATLRISITDQPDFVVTTANGAYTWETYTPLSAPSKTFAIHAVDTSSGATADGSYSVKSLGETQLSLVKTQGDSQTGAPGAQLPQKLRVQLQDGNGNPVIGVAVTFAASPGGKIVSATALTDENGQAEAALRLPPVEGLALATAEAARLVETFSARAAAASLPNYPAFLQSDAPWGSAALGKGAATIGQTGALLTAAAGIVRYYQNRGDLSGAAVDPGSLNQFLQNFCATDADGARICDGFVANAAEQVVNLWRVGALVGGKLDVLIDSPDADTVRDLVSQGSPVLLALSLPVGGHYVVAKGIAADGGILIHDPGPDPRRSTLSEYLAGGATLTAAIRLAPRTPALKSFLVSAASQPTIEIFSAAGDCGRSIDLPAGATLSRFRYCDGAQPAYQLSLTGPQPYAAVVTDLGAGGRRTELNGDGAAVAYKMTRPSAQLVLAPQDVTVSPDGIVSAATLGPGIAPGGLMTILGSGLSGPGAASVVDVNGVTAKIAFQSPFRINAEVPATVTPGIYPVRVQSPYGNASQDVEVLSNAPAIYLISAGIGAEAKARGVVTNQDNLLNAPAAPAKRGQLVTIYCTGLGVVSTAGGVSRTQAAVTGVLNGTPVTASFAGLSPGFIGLYQVNLPVPASTPPGIEIPLLLRESGRDSNTVFVSIQ